MYADFILLFALPLVVLEFILLFKRNDPIKSVLAGVLSLGVILIALSAPLMHSLSRHGMLVFNPKDSLLMIGTLPIEMYILVGCMSLFTGLLLYFLRPRIHPKTFPSRWIKFGGMAVFVVLALLGYIMGRENSTTHMGGIILWFSVIMYLGWFFAGSLVWRTRNMFLTAVVISTTYFSIVDGLAISRAYWSVNPTYVTSITVFGLPIERILFYLTLNLVLCQGLELFWYINRKKGLFAPRVIEEKE